MCLATILEPLYLPSIPA